MTSDGSLVSNRHVLLALASNLVLASPSVYLAVKVHAIGVGWTYDSYLVLAIVLVALLVAGAALAGWSAKKLRGSKRGLAVGIFGLHCLAFLVLLRAFGDVHGY